MGSWGSPFEFLFKYVYLLIDMNKKLEPFSNITVTSGFVKGFVNDDLVFELISEYVGRGKKWYGIIHDDFKTNEADPVALLSEAIYEDGAEIIEVCDELDGLQALIYDCEGDKVAFLVKKGFTVAFWAE